MSRQAYIHQLIDAYGKLESIDGHNEPNKSILDGRTVQAFLGSLEEIADALEVDCKCRGYRESFSRKYRGLFPDSSRYYRADLFSASIEPNDIYVNGEKFEISAQTTNSAARLQDAWKHLGVVLKPCQHTIQGSPLLKDVRSAIACVDLHWATFEEAYIFELMDIESKARKLISQAVKLEKLLSTAEQTKTKVVQSQHDFVKCIARINSVANSVRKGRDDLDASILHQAIIQQNESGDSDTSNGSIEPMIAKGVMSSFNALRGYFRAVANTVNQMDPDLSHNYDLVQLLVQWEESWEVGQKYLHRVQMCNAVNDIIAEVKQAQEVAPTLKEMCDSCDVELFLCTPRLVWLRFLAEPAECGELLMDLLPKRFPELLVDREVQLLQDRFRTAYQELLVRRQVLNCSLRLSPSRRKSLAPAVWELLVRRAVVGTDGAEALYDEVLPATPEGKYIQAIVEDLMLEIERWSMELQRHTPEDWNNFASVLLQCL